MKYIFIIIIISGLYGCFEQPLSGTGLEGQKIPGIHFLLTDSSNRINIDSIEGSQPFAILYFSPNCTYCRAQLRDIMKNNQSVNNIHFYLVSRHPLADVKKFVTEFKLNEYKNIITAIDDKQELAKYFYIPTVPYLAIYTRDKRLKKLFVGKTDFETIKSTLTN